PALASSSKKRCGSTPDTAARISACRRWRGSSAISAGPRPFRRARRPTVAGGTPALHQTKKPRARRRGAQVPDAGTLLNVQGEVIGDEGRLERRIFRSDEVDLNGLTLVGADVKRL